MSELPKTASGKLDRRALSDRREVVVLTATSSGRHRRHLHRLRRRRRRRTVTLGKAFSTPPDFADRILDALDVAARELDGDVRTVLSQTRLFLHSTTVAENAVVDGTLARAG